MRYETLLTKNAIYMDRTKGIGILPLEDAIAMGASGPMVRGSGLAWDIRKPEPYCGYEQYNFDVPVETGCDVYSRYLVRVAEMRQSSRILARRWTGFPRALYGRKPGVIFPPQEEIYTKMESLIHHFMLVVEGLKPPVGEVYQCIESPRGEIGCYMVSDGGPSLIV